MATPQEPDFPPGHPARFDYDPTSPEAIAWADRNIHPFGERDWPVGHPKAVDTAGNTNAVQVLPGVDPNRPELEAFTGRTPAQAAAVRQLWAERSKRAQPSPELEPTIAPPPPKNPGDTRPPSGQPDLPVSDQSLLDRIRGLVR